MGRLFRVAGEDLDAAPGTPNVPRPGRLAVTVVFSKRTFPPGGLSTTVACSISVLVSVAVSYLDIVAEDRNAESGRTRDKSAGVLDPESCRSTEI